MKPWKIILSIVLLLFSIIRLAATCNKQKKKAVKREFIERINAIESARSGIYSLQTSNTDSIPGSAERSTHYNRVVDSAIEHYRGIYLSDEKRYKQYLKVLFGYKKLAYEYQNLVKLYGNKELNKEKRDARFNDIRQNIRGITFDLERDRMAAGWDIFE